ncbi:helix-turn-helix domain-containing protein [Petroclostridium xylanilyticum]|uniref:helix-turn-helix domain-containing protein n=1 Tax=Petroclostridium xylanilyticum TaxID=1792311 RepID=UPI00241F309E|nr:helix-turn-helix transcriptional regulator [Petroclostridium xylanilyticum]
MIKLITCNIRILMAKHKIDDIQELINRSGLSRNAINRLYKGTDAEIEATSLKTLITLCKVFNCKLSDLLEYTPDSPEE